MPSRSFDAAADYYDLSRTLDEITENHFVGKVKEIVGQESKILDIGTGTGRLSVPLSISNAQVVGIDLSMNMMLKQKEKFPSAKLIQGDALFLPFVCYSFDAVLISHVLHLISEWQQALHELKRVLKKDGAFLYAQTKITNNSIRSEIKNYWRNIVKNYGDYGKRLGINKWEELKDELENMNTTHESNFVTSFYAYYKISDIIEYLRRRLGSSTWDIPDVVLLKSINELEKWVSECYPEKHKMFYDQCDLYIDVFTFR
jgi:ubiquinone/menaquinone biosynthesis C-methylase UbiE